MVALLAHEFKQGGDLLALGHDQRLVAIILQTGPGIAVL
jgi:hypothetical protein